MYDTKLTRHFSGITSHKVLKVENDKITIRRSANSDKLIDFPISDPGEWKVGDFADFFIIATGSHSYRCDFRGRTPEKFIDRDKDVITY